MSVIAHASMQEVALTTLGGRLLPLPSRRAFGWSSCSEVSEVAVCDLLSEFFGCFLDWAEGMLPGTGGLGVVDFVHDLVVLRTWRAAAVDSHRGEQGDHAQRRKTCREPWILLLWEACWSHRSASVSAILKVSKGHRALDGVRPYLGEPCTLTRWWMMMVCVRLDDLLDGWKKS